ncbi:hypothetical protein Csa_006669 [Cucumis sativus]|uniref:Uncharacterized protein n=1 Tax=Cucumis sativus TaxID=3659 RepID=A0A0A0LM19_CUCSA|nr:hypothetical protein Csa_006669 [Cucumis sativus]
MCCSKEPETFHARIKLLNQTHQEQEAEEEEEEEQGTIVFKIPNSIQLSLVLSLYSVFDSSGFSLTPRFDVVLVFGIWDFSFWNFWAPPIGCCFRAFLFPPTTTTVADFRVTTVLEFVTVESEKALN